MTFEEFLDRVSLRLGPGRTPGLPLGVRAAFQILLEEMATQRSNNYEQGDNMSLKAGTYNAKIEKYGIGTTKAGMAQVVVTFGVELPDGEGVQSLQWFGSLKEGRAREITFEALKELGFAGGPLTKLINESHAALDKAKTIEVTVEPNTYNGKTTMRIGWIGKRGSALATNDEAIAALAALGLHDGTEAPVEQLSDVEVPF